MATAESIFYCEPRGHYPLSEAAWIVGLRPQRISRWVSGRHVCASQQDAPPFVFCYQDLAEMLLIHDLLENHRVPWREITETMAGLRNEHGCWPLSRESLANPLTTMRADSSSRASLAIERDGALYQRRGDSWQQLLNPQTLGFITDKLSRGGWAVVLEPSLEHISIDPDYLSGRPAIKGRRVSAVDVATLAGDPGGEKILLDHFRLGRAEIDDAVKWWSAIQRTRAAA